jgi:hypothetical protein
LQKCPPDYEVTVILDEMPAPGATVEELVADPPPTVAVSAYVHATSTDHKEKCVYVFGCAVPMYDNDDEVDEDTPVAFNPAGGNLTEFQKRQIEEWMNDAHPEEGISRPLSNTDVTITYLLVKDLVRYDTKQKLFFKQGSPGYKALDYLDD